MFTPKELALERGWPGRIEGDRVIQLAAQTLQSFFTGGGSAREHAEYPLADVAAAAAGAAAAVGPRLLRLRAAREDGARAARARRCRRSGTSSRSSTSRTRRRSSGPRTRSRTRTGPRSSTTSSRSRRSSAPTGAIGGFTVMNDWSARDLQRAEMKVGLGPAKGKDFATSLGPVVVTPDEFDGSSGTMVARVNGEERSRGELGDMHFSWDARSSRRPARNTRLFPGDVLGSGTVGTGCILEHGDGRWLQPRRRRRARGRGDRRAAEHGRAPWLTSRSSGRASTGSRPRGRCAAPAVDVVVYEQFELGHARGSSHGRSRIFRLAYPETRLGAAGAGGARGLA